MVKIVVFDLDGTLYDSHKHIDKDTVHKIIELEQKGIVVGIVTGRFYEELDEVIEKLKLREHNGFVASSNGLEIHDFLDGKIKCFTRLSKDEVKELIEEAKKHHMISYVWRIRLQRELTRNGSTQKFMFPVGKIEQLTIYPLSFDEFLLNSNEKLFNVTKKAYESRTPLSSSIHELVLNEFYKYLLIGGMPEAVNTYFESNSFLESRRVLKDLYDNYLSDMELYQASRESCLRSKNLFSNIYGQLNKESKNFSP